MDQTVPATPIAPLESGMLPGSVPLPPGQDLSVISLFLQADTIVKLVMVLLLLASFWTWAIIFDKALRLRRLRNQAKQFEEAFWSGGSLEVLFDRLETQETLIRLLDLAEQSDGVRIFIGAESGLFGSSGVAMVVAPARNDANRIVGAIGVIGPARLNYARIIPLVDYTARVLGQVMNQ